MNKDAQGVCDVTQLESKLDIDDSLQVALTIFADDSYPKDIKFTIKNFRTMMLWLNRKATKKWWEIWK